MTTVLETQGLTKHFGHIHAVDGVSLHVRRGQIVGFLGPNGAGKTTTIGMILGLITPTAGEVALFGEPVTPARTAPLRRVGALVGATAALTPYLSVRRNLSLVARLHRTVGTVGTDAAVEATLALVGLADAADRRAANLSTGMKQRLGLAMALIHRPDLLILDEPTNGMDPAGMREVRTLLRNLADAGTTVFLSSHLLHEVEQLCDHVAVLDRGRIVAQGRVDELLGRSHAVKLRLRQPQEAALCLRTLPGVEVAESDGAYLLVSGPPSESVVAHLTSHGFIPSEVTSPRDDLETLFLELTTPSQKG